MKVPEPAAVLHRTANMMRVNIVRVSEYQNYSSDLKKGKRALSGLTRGKIAV